MNKEHGESLWEYNPSQHRFDMPNNIYRVTAGNGGESFLIDGGKTAIYDCGMAYCSDGLIENIEKRLSDLGKDNLDFVLISHSHYDHIGALPYIIKRWPDIKVVGAEKLIKVFSSDGAKKTMKRLGEAARDKYTKGNSTKEIITDGLRVDIILGDSDTIKIGDITVRGIWTPGHTDCSMSYYLEEPGVLFMSESVGVLENDDMLHTSILKSYSDTISSAEKLKSLKAPILICSHYGVVPPDVKDRYFDMYVDFAVEEKDFILNLFDQGKSTDEIFELYEKKYWSDSRDRAQPKEAFLENAGYTIKCIINEFRKQV